MKICIPTSNDRGPDSESSGRFGDAPFFAIADVDTGEVRVVRNPECHVDPHVCHHVSLLAAHTVQAVVCEGIGRRVAAGLHEAGIDVLVPARGTVADIVGIVRAGKARSLSADEARGRWRPHEHPGGAGHGYGHRHRRGHRRRSSETLARDS